jgi:membrane-bound lytic murein transglycosylase D
MAAVASRYGVSLGQLQAWNRTHRTLVSAGQVLVLHVPVGKSMPSEPGPEKLATSVQGGGVEKVSASVPDKPTGSRYDKKHGHARTGVVKVSAAAKKTSAASTKAPASVSSKASKPAASRQKTAGEARKRK